MALGATSAGTAVILALDHIAHVPNVSLLYIPAILFVAVYFGTWPSLFASVLAFLQYDFFLLQPVFTFSIRQAGDVLAFIVFVIVAVITSGLAARARERAEAAQRRANESTMLFELGQALMSTHDMEHILQTMTRQIVETFDVELCAIFTPEPNGRLALAAETAGAKDRDRNAGSIASWAFRHGTEVEFAVGDTGPKDQRKYVPLRTADRLVGLMEVGGKRSGGELDAEQYRVLTSFAAQAALVLGRAQADAERQRLELLEESDKLKTALLNAVSHDLRTPLASIKASATALLLGDASWTADQGRELLEAIDRESDRLNRLVGNLLDLSRIEAGVLRPSLDWYDMQEVVDTVLLRLSRVLGEHGLVVYVQDDLPLVRLDLVRIEELLLNLVENAAKYAPSVLPTEIRVERRDDGLCIAVVDHGPGIPFQARAHVFDIFYRIQRHGDRHPGTGLGLAICRGIAEIHGGTIRVEETPGGGATFVTELPMPVAGGAIPV